MQFKQWCFQRTCMLPSLSWHGVRRSVALDLTKVTEISGNNTFLYQAFVVSLVEICCISYIGRLVLVYLARFCIELSCVFLMSVSAYQSLPAAWKFINGIPCSIWFCGRNAVFGMLSFGWLLQVLQPNLSAVVLWQVWFCSLLSRLWWQLLFALQTMLLVCVVCRAFRSRSTTTSSFGQVCLWRLLGSSLGLSFV